MTPLQLPPMWADELPAVLREWFFAPTSHWLISRDPKLDEVHLIGITENTSPKTLRLVLRPGRPRPAWEAQVRGAFAATLDAAPDALDDDPVLLKHLAPQLPAGEAVLATAKRGPRYYDGGGWTTLLEWTGPTLTRPPSTPPPPDLDPEVAELMAGLKAMDDADRLALGLLGVLDQLDKGEQDAALASLLGLLHPQR